MMEMMDELGEMVGEQQKLMDETFNEQRRRQKSGDQQGAGQKPPPGMKGMGGEGQQQGTAARKPARRATRPSRASGQRGQRGNRHQQGQGDQSRARARKAWVSCRERQRELRERLGKLQREMREKGAGSGEQLEGARRGDGRAPSSALEQGDLDEATEQQGAALEQMRQGAQAMAQEMLRNMPQRYGQAGTRRAIRWAGRSVARAGTRHVGQGARPDRHPAGARDPRGAAPPPGRGDPPARSSSIISSAAAPVLTYLSASRADSPRGGRRRPHVCRPPMTS